MRRSLDRAIDDPLHDSSVRVIRSPRAAQPPGSAPADAMCSSRCAPLVTPPHTDHAGRPDPHRGAPPCPLFASLSRSALAPSTAETPDMRSLQLMCESTHGSGNSYSRRVASDERRVYASQSTKLSLTLPPQRKCAACSSFLTMSVAVCGPAPLITCCGMAM